MTDTVPLLALDRRASVDLDALLEVVARCGAGVEFELVEDETVERAAELAGAAGVALTLAPVESPALLAAVGARVRFHSGGDLPAVFTDAYPQRGFERGTPRTLALLEAAGALLLPVPSADSGLGLGVTSTATAASIMDAAFDHARSSGRGLVTVVHRASAEQTTDGLFLHTARNVAVRHSDVMYEDLAFEAFAQRAVRDRSSFEVLVGSAPVADAALAVLAAVADVPFPPGVVLARDDLHLFGRHGAAGGHAALFRATVALFEHLGQGRSAERLARALREAALQGDFGRKTAALVVAALSR